MRRIVSFDCAGDTLYGTIDEGADTTGLLIVSGGNELRSGAHRGMAGLAQALSAHGTPVFRYDRCGIGESTGENRGFAHARDDLLAAIGAFRTEAPHLTAIVAFGNCDAATTLALHGRAGGIERVMLANPWVRETIGDLPPRAAIKARYLKRLRAPRSWANGFSIIRLIKGLRALSAGTDDEADLTSTALSAIAAWGLDATVLLAADDATAIAYADAARRARVTPPTVSLPTSSHGFARPADQQRLAGVLLDFVSARE